MILKKIINRTFIISKFYLIVIFALDSEIDWATS